GNDDVRFRRRDHARLADCPRSLQTTLQLARKDGHTELFRTRHPTDQPFLCACRWSVAAQPGRRFSARPFYTTVPRNEQRLAHHSRHDHFGRAVNTKHLTNLTETFPRLKDSPAHSKYSRLQERIRRLLQCCFAHPYCSR